MVSQNVKNWIQNAARNRANQLANRYGNQYNNAINRVMANPFAANILSGGGGLQGIWDRFKTWLGSTIKFVIIWVVAIILIALQFNIFRSYVSPVMGSFWVFYMFPILLAVATLFIFRDRIESKLQYVEHPVVGLLIGSSILLFLVSLWGPYEAGSSGLLLFLFLGGILSLFAIFQIYKGENFDLIIMIALCITIFGFLAAGPYSAQFQFVRDGVGGSIGVAFGAITGGLGEIWFMLTDPYGYIQQQQIVNVVSETPMSQPKALEISRIDVLPPTIPACDDFIINTFMINEGDITVRDIYVGVGCNRWCSPPDEMDLDIEDDLFEGNKLRPGEGISFSTPPVTADVVLKKRKATFDMAKASILVSYSHETNSSLMLSVMDDERLNDLIFREQEDAYKPVTAVGKATPARLSLNVGVQPLNDDSKQYLLVSISNGRDDGDILLKKDDIIRLNVNPNLAIINTNDCGNNVDCEYTDLEKGIVECRIKPGKLAEWYDIFAAYERLTFQTPYRGQEFVTIKARDTDTIFHFICSMEIADIEDERTGLITAELPNYTFVLKKEAIISVKEPRGILSEIDECVRAIDLTLHGYVEEANGVFDDLDPGRVRLMAANGTKSIRSSDTEIEDSRLHYEFSVDEIEVDSVWDLNLTINNVYMDLRYKHEDMNTEFKNESRLDIGMRIDRRQIDGPYFQAGGLVVDMSNYCELKLDQTGDECILGEGGCKSDDECSTGYSDMPLLCREIENVTLPICCYEYDEENERYDHAYCKDQYENRMD